MINVASVTTVDINNGPGIRTTVWVSGCRHRCPGCHNQELWDDNLGRPLMSDEVLNTIFHELDKPYIDGLTISGGDPFSRSAITFKEDLLKLREFLRLIRKKYPNKSIWIYTGFSYEGLSRKTEYSDILELIDVLVDGRYVQELRDITLPFRGSKNQRLIDVQATRKNHDIIVEIDDENFRK